MGPRFCQMNDISAKQIPSHISKCHGDPYSQLNCQPWMDGKDEKLHQGVVRILRIAIHWHSSPKVNCVSERAQTLMEKMPFSSEKPENKHRVMGTNKGIANIQKIKKHPEKYGQGDEPQRFHE